MIFASSDSGWYGFVAIILVCYGINSLAKLGRRFDHKGEVKDAATKALVGMIGRWMK